MKTAAKIWIGVVGITAASTIGYGLIDVFGWIAIAVFVSAILTLASVIILSDDTY